MGKGMKKAECRVRPAQEVCAEIKKENCKMKNGAEGRSGGPLWSRFSSTKVDHPPSLRYGATSDGVKWGSESNQSGVNWS